MKNDELILGYADYNDNKYPFVYEKGILNLLPGTEGEWKKQRSELFHNFGKGFKVGEQNKWIENIYIYGITNKHKNIVFISTTNGSNNNGFMQYEIQTFYEYESNSIDEDLISGLVIQSNEIDYFFNPSRVFKSEIKFGESSCFESISVISDKEFNEAKYCGTYKSGDISIRIKISAYATYKTNSENPLLARSKIYLDFDKAVDLKEALEIIRHQESFLQYVCYRKNIKLKSIHTTRLKENGTRVQNGEIIKIGTNTEETNEKVRKQIITFELLEGKIDSILQSISNYEPYLEHIPSCIAKRNSYDISRMILIFAAFEREYSNFFSSEPIRSTRFLKSKEDVLDLLNEFKSNYGNSKSKKDIESFITIINDSGTSLGDFIEKAIKTHMNIIEMFLNLDYKTDDKNRVSKIAQRMNKMRNHIAHGNLDIEILPIHLSDLKILQILIYIMRLDSLEIKVKSIQKSICNLFGYNIYIPSENES